MMKRFIYSLAVLCAFVCARESFAVDYEASSLHNAVGRSETVQDLFFDRWSSIIDRQQYLDLYGKINWIPGFKVRTIDRATGDKKSIDMTLVRTYGSLTVTYPILGGYDKQTVTERLSKASGKKEDGEADAEKKEDDSGIVKPSNLVVGFTATGFHYGLTRSTEIDRGNAGNESVTDYKFTQFFDDIFALSLLYLPYVYVHGGVLVQNQIDPNPDGTMSYFSSKNGFPLYKYFFASNFMGFLDANATSSKGKIEKMGTAVEVKALVQNFEQLPSIVPKLTIGYKLLNAYHDEGYDAVWVKSDIAKDGSAKTDFMDNSLKQSARLHTFSFLAQEDISNILFLEFFTEFQYCASTLIEKRTDRKLTLRPMREIRGLIGVNVLGFNKTEINTLTFSVGMGNYWDPGISVQRSSGSGNSVTGGIFSARFENPLFGAELMVEYNYSKELRKLIESTDKVAIEGSAYFRI